MLAKKILFEMAIFDIVMMANTIGKKFCQMAKELFVKEAVFTKIWQIHEF